MEQLTETLKLDPEETNELAFKIKIEGVSASPAKVRLVCEDSNVSYMFNGYSTGESDIVQFTLPKMSDKLSEGTYSARVEVLIENRHFVPTQFQIEFKKPFKVVTESVNIVSRRPMEPMIKVTAAPVIIKKLVPKVSTPAPTISLPQKPQAETLREVYEKEKATSTRVPESDIRKIKEMSRKLGYR